MAIGVEEARRILQWASKNRLKIRRMAESVGLEQSTLGLFIKGKTRLPQGKTLKGILALADRWREEFNAIQQNASLGATERGPESPGATPLPADGGGTTAVNAEITAASLRDWAYREIAEYAGKNVPEEFTELARVAYLHPDMGTFRINGQPAAPSLAALAASLHKRAREYRAILRSSKYDVDLEPVPFE